MLFYAQLNENNICIAVSDLSGEVSVDNMIRIDDYDANLLGKEYRDGQWIERQESEQEEPVSSEEIQAMQLLEMQKINNKIDMLDETTGLLLLEAQKV